MDRWIILFLIFHATSSLYSPFLGSPFPFFLLSSSPSYVYPSSPSSYPTPTPLPFLLQFIYIFIIPISSLFLFSFPFTPSLIFLPVLSIPFFLSSWFRPPSLSPSPSFPFIYAPPSLFSFFPLRHPPLSSFLTHFPFQYFRCSFTNPL